MAVLMMLRIQCNVSSERLEMNLLPLSIYRSNIHEKKERWSATLIVLTTHVRAEDPREAG